ncbi:MAG: hypothetical protein N3I35_07955 [Clostridia bacterium]|nr:hypothetical protein [Clostridia bacterium]
MGNDSLKKIITAAVLIILFIIAVKILLKLIGFIFAILVPAAVLGLIAYFVYKAISGKKCC